MANQKQRHIFITYVLHMYDIYNVLIFIEYEMLRSSFDFLMNLQAESAHITDHYHKNHTVLSQLEYRK